MDPRSRALFLEHEVNETSICKNDKQTYSVTTRSWDTKVQNSFTLYFYHNCSTIKGLLGFFQESWLCMKLERINLNYTPESLFAPDGLLFSVTLNRWKETSEMLLNVSYNVNNKNFVKLEARLRLLLCYHSLIWETNKSFEK